MSGWGSGGGQWGTDDTVAGARLLYINRDVPNFRALVDVIDYRYAEVVAVSRQVEIGYDIDTAVGLQLDVLGASLGQAREAMADERYRRALRVQRAILSSGGTRSALVSTWNVWTTYALTSFHPAPPGDVWITGHAEREDEILLARYLQRAAAGGVIVNGYVVAPTETMLIGVHSFDSIADGLRWKPPMETLVDPISGITGTETGTPTYDTAADARIFDLSSTDELRWASPADLSGSPFTLSLWVQLDAYSAGGHTLFAIESSAGGYGCWFFVTGGSERLYFTIDYDTTDLVRMSEVVAIEGSAYHHVLVTYGGGAGAAGVNIYLDGTELAYLTTTDGVGTPDPLDGDWLLGHPVSGSTAWDGGIRGAPRLWDRVLTADEILTVYSGYDPDDYVAIEDAGVTDYSADPITGAAICASRIV